MNPDDTLPPVPPAPSAAPAGDDSSELWPSSGPAKGFRVRLPIAIAAVVVVALAGAAAGASLKKTPSTTSQAGAISNNRAGGTFGGAGGTAGANRANGANGAGRAFGRGGGVLGTVTKVDGNTITVTQRDGTTATGGVPSGTP